ncbi:MAG: cyclic nucleotide-binding domain-containing protein [Elusimicrobiales bacterium]|jgi:CRP-like cAMP-binding protein
MDKDMEALGKAPLFRNFSDRMLEEFCGVFNRSSYKAGEIIFREKSPGDTLFILVTGQVVIEKALDASDKDFKQLAILSDGEFFGEMALLEGAVRFAQARAEKDSSVYVIKREDFFRFITEHPENGIALFTEIVRVLSKRLQHTSSELTMLFDMSGLVMRDHESPAEFIKKTVEEIRIYFDGVWNLYGYAYNRFNEEFEAVVSLEAFARGAAEEARGEPCGGWLNESTYLMVFHAHGKKAGYIVFARSTAVSGYERNNLTTIFNTISSIMGSAVENIEHRMEDALLRKLRTRKDNL